MRRSIRILGTVLIVLGVGTLAWAVVVWRWQDPFTALYTRYEQHKLASQFGERLASFKPLRDPGPSLAARRREIALEAARYRQETREGDAIGRIKVPRLGLDMIFVNGTGHDDLTKGPGRDMHTYMPGQGQLIYIAGHRTTYLAPFSHIDELRPGDSVTLQLPYATFLYRVRNHVIVPADDLARLASHGREVLALQACHPRFFATHRYIVYAYPVQVLPRGGSPFAPAPGVRALAGVASP